MSRTLDIVGHNLWRLFRLLDHYHLQFTFKRNIGICCICSVNMKGSLKLGYIRIGVDVSECSRNEIVCVVSEEVLLAD